MYAHSIAAQAADIRRENLLQQLAERDRLLMSWLAAAQLPSGSEKRYSVSLVAAQTKRLLGIRS